jgi:hypothetical protein
MVRACQSQGYWPMTILELSFADEEDTDLAVDLPIRTLSQENLASRCEAMSSRLKSHCLGLLKISHNYEGIETFAGTT